MRVMIFAYCITGIIVTVLCMLWYIPFLKIKPPKLIYWWWGTSLKIFGFEDNPLYCIICCTSSRWNLEWMCLKLSWLFLLATTHIYMPLCINGIFNAIPNIYQTPFKTYTVWLKSFIVHNFHKFCNYIIITKFSCYQLINTCIWVVIK